MDAGDIDEISDRGALEGLPAAHYRAAATRARRLQGEATTSRLKEFLRANSLRIHFMPIFAASEAPPRLESMKFPVFGRKWDQNLSAEEIGHRGFWRVE
jgi:hypothetical protein